MKLKIKMKKIFLAAFAVLFSFSASAQTTDRSADVKKFVEEIGNKVITIAGDTKTSDSKRREKIINVVDSSIDPDWIARFVLGKNYKAASDDQRDKFTKLYRDFMINTYGPKFKNYNGKKFTVLSVAEQGGFYVAKSEFLPRDSDVAISVDFRVKERNGRLVILDFIAEGISLIETQRSEFNSAIAQKGMDKFLEELAERVVKLKNQK